MKQLTEGTHIGHVYLYSVPASMYELLNEGVFVYDQGHAINTIAAGAVYGVVLVVFVMCAALMVMNMPIGVFCEVRIVAHFFCWYVSFLEWYV